MLVAWPNMDIAQLDPDNTEKNTLLPYRAEALIDRLGEAHFNFTNGQHWYAKLDGMPIHIQKTKDGFFRIECLKTQVLQVSEAINLEVKNGVIT